MTWEAILFYLLLLDSVTATLVMLFGPRWYMQHFRIVSRWFPPAPGWPVYYFVLVLYIGFLLFRLGKF